VVGKKFGDHRAVGSPGTGDSKLAVAGGQGPLVLSSYPHCGRAGRGCRGDLNAKLAPFKRGDSRSVSSELLQAEQALRFAAVDEAGVLGVVQESLRFTQAIEESRLHDRFGFVERGSRFVHMALAV